ncbi:riboflavin biosynthesis protein PYRD, chloroplastic [Melia azedarach]|uniref:Riboflavin biosynthesis protein PYRD, chloroplastic n=1 Tax=Melia azedarach TaxID=155640 RepID=A0ACC1YU19_MELAZ|nr:riboflavin biosynthesis protein PYRD, chloroplastic [Melia azedarach]
MQIQSLSLPNHILSPRSFYFSSSSIQSPAIKLVFNQSSKSGFCSSLKMASKSLTSVRKSAGGGVRVRCGVVQEDNDDGFYIRRCVQLARKAIGHTSPNPMVGCVIVKDGKIVGEGFHPKAGQPHAEIFALRDAGELAENGTAYVSLEPCNHYGRTPPCTEALIKAKVKKVVVGMVDPNPIVDSKGLERLRNAGIDVTVGVEEELCKRLNEAFIHRMLTQKPFVTVRYSLSVNGHLLYQLGEGVTESGGYYSQLLQEYDAIILPASLAGKYSLLASQEPGANQPFQIITAFNVGSPIQLPSLSEETASKVMGFCSVLLDLRGNDGDLEMLLKMGIEQNLLQKIMVEVLPIWSESDGGNPHALLNSLGKGLRVKNLQPKMSSQSIVLEGYL